MLLLTSRTFDSCGFAFMPAFLCYQADGIFCTSIESLQDVGGAICWDLYFILPSRGGNISETVAIKLGQWSPPAQREASFSGIIDPQVLGTIQV